jgi:hypothetical protein
MFDTSKKALIYAGGEKDPIFLQAEVSYAIFRKVNLTSEAAMSQSSGNKGYQGFQQFGAENDCGYDCRKKHYPAYRQ